MILVKDKPKITLFLPSLDIGGVERVMLNLATGFTKIGASVDLVLARAEGGFLHQVHPDIRVVDLQAGRVLASLWPLARYLRTQRPDALISAKDYANVIAIVAKFLARVQTRVVVTVHTTLSRHVQYAQTIRERAIVPLLARHLYPYAYRIVAVSDYVADDLAQFLGLRRELITVVYNPVVTEDLFKAAEAHVDHPWFAPGEPPVLVSIGRLTAAKDYSTLITAFAKVRCQRVARLVIFGDGEQKSLLQHLVRRLGLESDVWMPGFVESPYPYLARAALFVLSSIWEGLPTVIIEALALGVPVVATDCAGGVREILDNGRFGILVPVGDADRLADAIIWALDASHDRYALRERAKDFLTDNIVSQYLFLLGFKANTE